MVFIEGMSISVGRGSVQFKDFSSRGMLGIVIYRGLFAKLRLSNIMSLSLANRSWMCDFAVYGNMVSRGGSFIY